MITQSTVQNVIDTAKVEDVVGDYVTLKKRGANLIGLCPFHNEKTPSFNVSPTKGIYKCFGCGEAGDSIKFLMEHESFTFPEAIRHLAAKYNIEIEETEDSAEVKAAQDLRDSLFIITHFAQQYFTDLLFNHEQGKSIGLSYFKERGFRTETIKKFELGYCLDRYDHFTQTALKKGYQLELLKQTGLVKSKDNKHYDFFRDRVQFPVHNLSGKIIAFGGRTLKQDKKIPKYINSPETEIYNKSKVLYGIYFAKKAIRDEDNCYLVEGYTDVISLHQEGIENVVASSGTSLTEGQIQLIKRFTHNITILYDGDQAGIKAALRGIDLILEEGMNVKIVLLPTDEDPDSFIKKSGASGFKDYIKNHSKDFIFFKTDLLLEEASQDPVQKAELIKDIVNSIAYIPDPIKRAVYVRECSVMMDIHEQVLLTEIQKSKRQHLKKASKVSGEEAQLIEEQIEAAVEQLPSQQKRENRFVAEYQERDIIRLLLEFGHKPINDTLNIAEYILDELQEIEMENPLFNKVTQEYKDQLKTEIPPTQKHFLHHPDASISELASSLLLTPYEISENWEKMFDIIVPEWEANFIQDVKSGVTRFKLTKVKQMFNDNQKKLKEAQENHDLDEITTLMKVSIHLKSMEQEIAKVHGTVIN